LHLLLFTNACRLEKLIRESHKRGPPSSPNDIAHLTDPTNPGNPFGLFFLKFRYTPQPAPHLLIHLDI
jgi:hypothetical protein